MKNERREILYLRSGGLCALCKKPLVSDYQVHHGGAHDTNGNNINYPLYTQSLLCKKPMHDHCHDDNPGFGHIPDTHIKAWETILLNFKCLVKFGADIPMDLLTQELILIQKENRRK